MKILTVTLLAVATAGCSAPELMGARASMSGAMKFEEPVAPPRVVVDDAGTGLERRVSGDKVQVTEEMIAKLLAQRDALVFPAKLAVVKITRDGGGYRPEALSSRELEAFQSKVRDDRRVSGVETVSSFFLTRETDLQRLRYAAARIGCSMLFIYMKDTTTAHGWNSTANLNFLIVPLFLVNGKTVKAETAMEGVLVGVGSNVAHLVSNSKVVRGRDVHNLASSDDALQAVREEAEAQALLDVSQDLARKLSELK
jgi:hypothetical protein